MKRLIGGLLIGVAGFVLIFRRTGRLRPESSCASGVTILNVATTTEHTPCPQHPQSENAMKKTFPLSVVLTVTTGRLLTEPKSENDNGIGELYEILNHMTQDNLFTHQLPRASEECAPWLLRWFPELKEAGSDEAMKMLDDAIASGGSINGWLAGVAHRFSLKSEYEIEPIPRDDHEQINPYDELVQMRGSDEGIVIIGKANPPIE